MQDRGPRNCPLPPKGHTAVVEVVEVVVDAAAASAPAATTKSLPLPSTKPLLLLLPPPGTTTEGERERGEFRASTLTASTRVCVKLEEEEEEESTGSRDVHAKLEAQVEKRHGMTVAHRAAFSPTLGGVEAWASEKSLALENPSRRKASVSASPSTPPP